RRWQRHSEHLGGWHRRGGAPRSGLAAARHEPVDHSHVAGHEPCRLRADLRIDLHAPVLCSALLNSLDHITNGRIAFNVISSQRRSDHENYGYDELIDHGERYNRMEEFIAVCQAPWSSVDADAFVWVRPINYV